MTSLNIQFAKRHNKWKGWSKILKLPNTHWVKDTWRGVDNQKCNEIIFISSHLISLRLNKNAAIGLRQGI